MTFSASGAAALAPAVSFSLAAAWAAAAGATLGGALFTAVMSVKPDAMLSSSKPEPPAMESAEVKG